MSNTNTDRVLWAEAAIDAFVGQTGQDKLEDDPVSDLIADLGHYCDENRIDFVAAIQRGISHWKAETIDPADCNRIDIMPAVSIQFEGGVS